MSQISRLKEEKHPQARGEKLVSGRNYPNSTRPNLQLTSFLPHLFYFIKNSTALRTYFQMRAHPQSAILSLRAAFFWTMLYYLAGLMPGITCQKEESL